MTTDFGLQRLRTHTPHTEEEDWVVCWKWLEVMDAMECELPHSEPIFAVSLTKYRLRLGITKNECDHKTSRKRGRITRNESLFFKTDGESKDGRQERG